MDGITYGLTMTFTGALGDKVSLSLVPVRGDITQAEVNGIMDEIIAKNIFETKAGDLVRKQSASLKETVMSKFTMTQA